MVWFRSSRRPFTPPDHWLVTSHVDMNTFIQAAMYVPLRRLTSYTYLRRSSLEERQLSQPETLGLTGARALALNMRQVAYLSPRLGVLNNIPVAVPFDVRVGIFRRFVLNDADTRGLAAPWRGGSTPCLRRASVGMGGTTLIKMRT